MKLFPERDKLEVICFCHIIPMEEDINPINPAKTAKKLKPSLRSEIIIIAPAKPKVVPIHCSLENFSSKYILANIAVKIGVRDMIRAITLAEIPLDKA